MPPKKPKQGGCTYSVPTYAMVKQKAIKMDIAITKENFNKFQKAYDKAVKEKLDSFEFEGTEVLTTYAKYVIEYVKSAK